MTDQKPSPTPAWGLLMEDIAVPEDGRRLIGVYYDAAHANADAIKMQADGLWVEVVPFFVHRAPQWADALEPAWERTDADFDVPVNPS